MSDLQAIIKEQVTTHPVVLYMKGSPQFPRCGFSGRAVQILKACGVNKFFSVDVLQNPEYTPALVEYASWPTLPQFYIKGEFIGGCDIMTEMHQAGELQPMLDPFKN